jgi:ATP-binding cassette, subfamily C, bacterial CydC
MTTATPVTTGGTQPASRQPNLAGVTLGQPHADTRGRRPLLRLLALARPLRLRLLLAALAGAAAIASGIALLAVSGFLLARASQHPNIVAISIAVVAVRALGISRGAFRYAERLGSHDVAFRVLADVRVAIYRQLERLAPAGLADFRSGDLLARLVSDVDAMQDLYIRGLSPPLAAALAGAGAVLTAVALLAPAGLLLCAGLLTAGLAVPFVAARTARLAAQRSAAARGKLGAQLTDVLSGAADAHAFGAEDELLARATAADAELTMLSRRSAAASGLGSGLMAAAGGATLWGVLLLGVAATGSGTFGRVPLAVVTLTALAAFEAVTALPAAAIQLGQASTAARRIGAVLDAPDPVREPARPLALPAGRLHIRLTGASVRYYPGGPLAIDGVDLDLPAGKRVALVGPTGAGKSTIASVLLRFCDLCGGTATLNDNDLAAYSADDVRSRIGGCPQDAHIFDTTIAANLRLAKPGATDAELMAVADRVRLAGWIASLPAGLATRVGAHGAQVSGGQRQRLALARALLADPAVLILDEPTAHLDAANKQVLLADLLAVTGERSLLLITHDLDSLDQLDEIVVLRAGRVAERGPHGELMARDGLYRAMWQASRVAG